MFFFVLLFLCWCNLSLQITCKESMKASNFAIFSLEMECVRNQTTTEIELTDTIFFLHTLDSVANVRNFTLRGAPGVYPIVAGNTTNGLFDIDNSTVTFEGFKVVNFIEKGHGTLQITGSNFTANNMSWISASSNNQVLSFSHFLLIYTYISYIHLLHIHIGRSSLFCAFRH